MSENPFEPPRVQSAARPWYRRPSLALIVALVSYGAAILVSNGARLAYDASDVDEYAMRVSPTIHIIVKTLMVILLSVSVASLLTIPVLILLNRRSRTDPNDPQQ